MHMHKVATINAQLREFFAYLARANDATSVPQAIIDNNILATCG